MFLNRLTFPVFNNSESKARKIPIREETEIRRKRLILAQKGDDDDDESIYSL